MRSFSLADLDAYLCSNDMPGRDPACVYLHGIGSSSEETTP